MVSGVARVTGSPMLHRKKNPARYCATRITAAAPSTHFAARRPPCSAGARQAATFAFGLIPDFFDEALVTLDAKLDDDIDEQVQEALDVRARKLRAAATLLHEQHELLEGELCAC